jgi:hypothetical protein
MGFHSVKESGWFHIGRGKAPVSLVSFHERIPDHISCPALAPKHSTVEIVRNFYTMVTKYLFLSMFSTSLLPQTLPFHVFERVFLNFFPKVLRYQSLTVISVFPILSDSDLNVNHQE